MPKLDQVARVAAEGRPANCWVKQVLWLSRTEVRGLLPTISEQLDLVESTYRALAAGRIELPPKPGIHPRQDSFIHAMPAYLRDEDIAALKWVAGYPGNKKRGLPYISGLIVVNDTDTGLPQAVMDGAEITAARTAAASGVCIRRWAPDHWREVAILGCGEQSRFHARMLTELNREVRIRAYDPHPDRIAQLEGRVSAAAGPTDAVAGADVVVTAGPIVVDPSPAITSGWLSERFLALPIDFDFYFHPEAIESANLFLVDDIEQFEHYRDLGHFRGWPQPDSSVGEALGQTDSPPRVACCNLGVGALDAAFAQRVLVAADEHGVGTSLHL